MLKIFTNIYKLSFAFYVLMLFAAKYVTARTWADVSLILFIISIIYQLTYIIFLHKKDDVSLGKTIILFFTLAVSAVTIHTIIGYISLYINGYTPTDWVGNTIGKRVYGLEAIQANPIENIVNIIWLIINLFLITLNSDRKY